MKLAVHHFSVESEREGGDDVSEVAGGADVDGAFSLSRHARNTLI